MLLERQNGEDVERDIVGDMAADALMEGGGTAWGHLTRHKKKRIPWSSMQLQC